MMERIETALPPVPPGAGWGLNLTAQRRQRTLCCRLLRTVVPFLAWGGRPWLPTAAAGSPGLPTAIPWPAPRRFEWPDRDLTSAHTKEPAMCSPQAITAGATAPAAPNHAQQPGPPPAPALVLPFAGGRRTPEPLSPIQAEAVVSAVRAKRETTNMAMGRAFPQTYIGPQVLPFHAGRARQTEHRSVPEAKAAGKPIVAGAVGEETGSPPVSGHPYGPMLSRLPKLALSWGLPSGFRGVTPGTFPAAFSRIMTAATPAHRAKQAEFLRQSLPEAVIAPEMPPLPEHKLYGGPGTAAPAVSLQGLGLVLDTIRQTMKREVAQAVREREEEAQAPATNRAGGLDLTTAEHLVSDNLVRGFMQKMSELAEEERFRLGLLR